MVDKQVMLTSQPKSAEPEGVKLVVPSVTVPEAVASRALALPLKMSTVKAGVTSRYEAELDRVDAEKYVDGIGLGQQ